MTATFDRIVDRWGEGVGVARGRPAAGTTRPASLVGRRCSGMGASPGMARRLFGMYPHADVRGVLPRRPGADAGNAPPGRPDASASGSRSYLAEHIPGARLVELEGEDHLFFVGDIESRWPRSRSSDWTEDPRPGRARWLRDPGRHDAAVRADLTSVRG